MRRSYILLLALALAGCGAAQQQPSLEQQMYAQTKALYEGDIGKEYWVKGGILRFCPVPAFLDTRCEIIREGHLKIDGIEQGIFELSSYGNVPDSKPYYHVKLDDGRTGFVLPADLSAQARDFDCKPHDPRIGMTAKQVEATCWGKPDHVNRTETAGVISDQYVYGDSRYVYLQNGIVTSIQASGTLRQ